MPEQVLLDLSGRQMGAIETLSDGRQIARELSGRKVGEYDPRGNVTRDLSGRTVAVGNVLSSLIVLAQSARTL